MRLCIAGLVFVSAAALAQSPTDETLASLIRKLGSSDFRERDAATKALKERPDAMSALQETARAGDHLELRRRAQDIVDYLRLRGLNSAVDVGDFQRFIKLAAVSPNETLQDEVFPAAERLARRLNELHFKKTGKNIRVVNPRTERRALNAVRRPSIIDVNKVTTATKAEDFAYHFVRANEVDLDIRHTAKPANIFLDGMVFFVVSGPVLITPADRHVIFAGGPVEMGDSQRTGEMRDALIVSAGSVTLHSDLINCLVIARGTITCSGEIKKSHIIAGGRVHYDEDRVAQSIISENDANPLGFIRWSDPPKDKGAPQNK